MVTPALSRRVAAAFQRAASDLTPEERRSIVEAVEEAETWEKLPSAVQAVIEKYEALPA